MRHRPFLIHTILFLSGTVVVVSACGGPIETRTMTQTAAPLPVQKQYALSSNAEQNNVAYSKARELTVSALGKYGFTENAAAPILVNIAIADRPADMTITIGEEKSLQTLVTAKKSKALQSCADREHRLTIIVVDKNGGELLYSGTAAEYHCKGTVNASLPYLVNGALADLNSGTSQDIKNKTLIRSGLE